MQRSRNRNHRRVPFAAHLAPAQRCIATAPTGARKRSKPTEASASDPHSVAWSLKRPRHYVLTCSDLQLYLRLMHFRKSSYTKREFFHGKHAARAYRYTRLQVVRAGLVTDWRA